MVAQYRAINNASHQEKNLNKSVVTPELTKFLRRWSIMRINLLVQCRWWQTAYVES